MSSSLTFHSSFLFSALIARDGGVLLLGKCAVLVHTKEKIPLPLGGLKHLSGHGMWEAPCMTQQEKSWSFSGSIPPKSTLFFPWEGSVTWEALPAIAASSLFTPAGFLTVTPAEDQFSMPLHPSGAVLLFVKPRRSGRDLAQISLFTFWSFPKYFMSID